MKIKDQDGQSHIGHTSRPAVQDHSWVMRVSAGCLVTTIQCVKGEEIERKREKERKKKIKYDGDVEFA